MLPICDYKTAAGSTMKISGKHGGIYEVDFDWFEEGGCYNCEPSAREDDGFLVWYCEECGGGRAELKRCEG